MNMSTFLNKRFENTPLRVIRICLIVAFYFDLLFILLFISFIGFLLLLILHFLPKN